MSYLFGRLHQGALILQPCHFAPPFSFDPEELSEPRVMPGALRTLVDAKYFYTRIVLAIPTEEATATVWTSALEAVGYTRLDNAEVRTLVEGFGPVIGREYHPEHSNLWGFGTMEERVEEAKLVVQGNRVFIQGKLKGNPDP